jgi:hypothetical protein
LRKGARDARPRLFNGKFLVYSCPAHMEPPMTRFDDVKLPHHGVERPHAEEGRRQPWERPAVIRIRAGEAEIQGGSGADNDVFS